ASGGKGPQFRVNARRGKAQETGVSLRAPESVQKLQTALHAKAKEVPTYRFYALYDKLFREDVLNHAWRLAKANARGGAHPGAESLAVAATRHLRRDHLARAQRVREGEQGHPAQRPQLVLRPRRDRHRPQH